MKIPYSKTIICAGSLIIILSYTLLLTPTYDDGNYGMGVINTIKYHNPYYNNYYNQILPIQKLSILIYSIVFTQILSFSFHLLGFVQGLFIVLSGLLVNKISKHYFMNKTSLAASLIYVYLMIGHEWLSPMRPELWLSIIGLLVFYLLELFIRKEKMKFIFIACFLTGAIAITFHSNASILYIYLILYLITYRKIISKKRIIISLIFLFLSTAVGLLIIFLPDITVSLKYFLSVAGADDNRFGFYEFHRFLIFYVNEFYRYVGFYLFLLFIAWFIYNRSDISKVIISIKNKYKNILLYFISIFIGMGILPSASWAIYILPYFFPLSLLFAYLLSDFHTNQTTKLMINICIFILGLEFIGAVIINGDLLASSQLSINMPNFIREIIPDIVYKHPFIIFIFFYLPVLIRSIIWPRYRFYLLYLILTLGLSYKTFLLYNQHSVFSEVQQLCKKYKVLNLVGPAEFIWMDIDGKPLFISVPNDSSFKWSGHALLSEKVQNAYPVKDLISNCPSCKFKKLEPVQNSFKRSSFISDEFNYRYLSLYSFSKNEN